MEVEPGGRPVVRTRDKNPKRTAELHAELANIAKAQGVGPVTDIAKFQASEKFDDSVFDQEIMALRSRGLVKDPFSK